MYFVAQHVSETRASELFEMSPFRFIIFRVSFHVSLVAYLTRGKLPCLSPHVSESYLYNCKEIPEASKLKHKISLSMLDI
jgi:Na+/H+ antiporter NhaC